MPRYISKYKNKSKHILRNINIVVFILTILSNCIIFALLRNNKHDVIIANTYISIFYFFLYSFIVQLTLKKNVNEIKKEALYIDYPSLILKFLICFVILLIISVIALYTINPDVFVITFIFMFYISILAMIFPSIMLLIYIFFIVPSLVVPTIQINRKETNGAFSILSIFFIIFIIFGIYKYIEYQNIQKNILSLERYKANLISIQYSNKFLNLGNISPYGKKKMSKSTVNVPFIHTTESIISDNYETAEAFCNSINARIPNYLEMYNIAFNNFDTFGENYYWTSNEDEKKQIVIHFKNMSYTAEKYTKNTKPYVYCIVDKKDYKNVERIHYFINDVKVNTETDKSYKYENKEEYNDNLFFNIKNKQQNNMPSDDEIKSEKRHINFSVKEVNSSVMHQLLQKGYYYDTNIKISPKFEASDNDVENRIIKDKNRKSVRLCYFPFMDYGTMTLNEEAQIWSQSFCSPSFEVIEQFPALKTRREKDTYCNSIGGRLPNIPELTGLLKSLSVRSMGVKYWTNSKVTQTSSRVEYPVTIYFEEPRFAKVTMQKNDEKAYVYCIKNSQKPSKIISNYKSRFKGIDGKPYAKTACPSCQYYELPDTVLQSY